MPISNQNSLPQKQLKESYNSYIESIVMDQQDNNPNTGRPNKRLYTFIEQQKSNSREINSLIKV